MAIEIDPRTGLKTYSAGTDPHPTRIDHKAERDLLAAIMAMAEQGPTGDRPTSGKWGRFYWDTTVNRLYFDDGTQWMEVTTNGGGGAGRTILVAGGATEGSSDRSARADHVHSIPLATAFAHGAMASTDKAALDGAASNGAANQIVKNDSSGRHSVTTPTAASHASNKGYVDAGINSRAPSSHNHNADDINAGIFNPLRLPVVTVSAQGAMLAADKQKLDAATHVADANSLARRDGLGRIQVAYPGAGTDATSKTYVDNQISGRSPSGHTHSYSSLTGVPSTFEPSLHSHSWSSITSKPSTFPPSGHTHAIANLSDAYQRIATGSFVTVHSDWRIEDASEETFLTKSGLVVAFSIKIQRVGSSLTVATLDTQYRPNTATKIQLTTRPDDIDSHIDNGGQIKIDSVAPVGTGGYITMSGTYIIDPANI